MSHPVTLNITMSCDLNYIRYDILNISTISSTGYIKFDRQPLYDIDQRNCTAELTWTNLNSSITQYINYFSKSINYLHY